MSSEAVHRSRANKAFQHSLIQQPRIDRLAELKNAGEMAERFARLQNSFHGVLADVLDGAQDRSESDRRSE